MPIGNADGHGPCELRPVAIWTQKSCRERGPSQGVSKTALLAPVLLSSLDSLE